MHQSTASPVSVLPECVSCLLISCLAWSCLNGSQTWPVCTLLLSQPPRGLWWQRSQGHSFISEIRHATYLLSWQPNGTLRTRQALDQNKASIRLSVTRLRGAESWGYAWDGLCVCQSHGQHVWMSSCGPTVCIRLEARKLKIWLTQTYLTVMSPATFLNYNLLLWENFWNIWNSM